MLIVDGCLSRSKVISIRLYILYYHNMWHIEVPMTLWSFVVVTWMCDKKELVECVTLWNNTKCSTVMWKLMISYMGHVLVSQS